MRGRHNLPAPILGVSALAPRNQPEGMMTEQVNMRSDPVRKLSRRPAMEFGQRIDTQDWKAYHTFTRNGIKYEIGVSADDAVLVLRDGVYTATNIPNTNVADYLENSLTDEILMHTVADTTFIVNTNKLVASTTYLQTVIETSYINVVSALNYGEELTIRLQWEYEPGALYDYEVLTDREATITILIPNADNGDYETADLERATKAVALAISDAINNISLIRTDTSDSTTLARTGADVCVSTQIGSVVSVSTANLYNMSINVDGGQGTSSVLPIQRIKQDTSGMPKYAIADTVVQIQPGLDSNNSDGAYYLLATAISDLDPADVGELMTEVYWQETTTQAENSRLQGRTMPIIVRQTTVPEVTNDDDEWGERNAGDDESNPMPSFVGKTISAIGTFQGRLTLGAGSEVTMSNTDSLYLFFRKSVLQLLATDVVGLGASSTDTADITGFGIHDKDLIVNFSSKQLKVTGAAAVTPVTTAMTPSTAYATSPTPSPLAFAGSLLLPFTYGESGGVWDYTQKEQNEQNTAVAITRMVEGYLSADIQLWAASSALDIAIVKCTDGNTLYVYEQTTLNDQRTQMAWSKWDVQLDDDILWMGFDENKLNIITVATGGTGTYRRTIDLGTTLPDALDNIYLDDMVQVVIADGGTTGELPANYPDHADLVYVQASDCKSPNYEAQVTRAGTTLTVSTTIHDTGDATLFVGRPFTSSFTPTRYFIREEGEVVDIDRLSVKAVLLDVVHTNEVTMDTISKYYDANPLQVLADRVGVMQLGVKSFYSGDFNFPIRKQAKWATQRFYTNGYLPMNIIGMTWQGLYKQRMERF